MSDEEWAALRQEEEAAAEKQAAAVLQRQERRAAAAAAAAETFDEELWLTPRTRLTADTPVTTLNRFCVDHGFYLKQLGAATPQEQRAKLRSLLLSRGWPQGRQAYLRALKAPHSPRSALPLTGAS